MLLILILLITHIFTKIVNNNLQNKGAYQQFDNTINDVIKATAPSITMHK